MHIDYANAAQSAKSEISKCKNCTLEELAVLKAIAKDSKITQKSLATRLGLSERTIKTLTVSLQEKGCLRRVNGKRNGFWEVIMMDKMGD